MASLINASTSPAGIVQTADGTGILALQTGNTTAVTIDASQNVGIGTATPTRMLDVSKTTGDAGVAITSSTTGQSSIFFADTDINVGMIYYEHTNDAMGFRTNDAERMRIDSSGNVLVGCTSAPSASVSGVRLSNPTSIQSIFSTAPNTGAYTAIAFFNGNGQVGRIDTSGSSTVYVTSSDYRLKENIAPMTGALDKVALLKPVTYKWKIDGKSGDGFIAHELAEVCSDAVVGEKDAVETYTDEEGIEQTRIKPQGVDTSFLVATLTAAIQEQQALITSLTARITALEGA